MGTIFDTHAHYDEESFDKDREELFAALQKQGIAHVVNVGASLSSSKKTLALVRQYPFLYGAVGIHPNETEDFTEEGITFLKEAAMQEKIVAIGEIGLDYYWDQSEIENQKKWFVRQLKLAKEVALPVIIHSREAAKDTLELMKENGAEQIGGVIHCFSYSEEMAEEFLKLGFYLGIGGVITFPNAKKLKKVVERTPIERIVLETDCPYLAPVPNRGKRNSSLNLPFVAEEIARIKKISYEEVVNQTDKNAKIMYHIPV